MTNLRQINFVSSYCKSKDDHAQNSWFFFVKVLIMFVIDFLLLGVGIVMISFIVTMSINFFWKKTLPSFSSAEVAKFLGQIAWPFVVVVLAVCFRSPISQILDATVKFILKSHYKYGDDGNRPLEQNEPEEMIGAEELAPMADNADAEPPKSDETSQNKNISTSRKLARTLLDLAAKEVVLNKFQTEVSRPVFRGYGIAGFKIKFDGTVDFPDGTIFGVKVFRDSGLENLESTVSTLTFDYSKLEKESKRRFLFVAYAVGDYSTDKQNKIAEIIDRLPCNHLLRFSKYNGAVYKEF